MWLKSYTSCYNATIFVNMAAIEKHTEMLEFLSRR